MEPSHRGMSFGDVKRGMYGEGGTATTRFSGWTGESGCVRLSFGCQRNKDHAWGRVGGYLWSGWL